MIIYANDENNLSDYHVAVSQVYFSEHKILKCILGSCVSVILFSIDRSCSFSSMSHFLLDKPGLEPLTYLNEDDPDKYGSIMIPKQLKEMQKKIETKDLRAMIFGGASGNDFFRAKIIADIGRRNIEIAENIMAENNVEIIAKNTGEKFSRYVEYNPEKKIAKLRILQSNETFYYPINQQ